MGERIQLLDIPVDTVSTREACETTIGYLEAENSEVVYFLNSETLLLLQGNQEWKDIVGDSGLVLPGNAEVNTSINEVLGHERDPFFYESYFDTILDRSIEKGYEILLLTEDENRFISVQENIHEKRPFLTLSGVFLTEAEESMEHVVNEINSVAPDILFVALKEKQQLELIERYRTQMNAGLLLFTGNILYHKAVSEAEVPEQIQKLKIDYLYKWFRRDGRVRTFFNNLQMKLRLKRERKKKDS
ncbi:MAG: WecB/TagA/CpsF family glycosyltransferase [Clostridium sp.]|nr:WecB/TagA/CpsF family glycosyltransferase [Clostridium sp.]